MKDVDKILQAVSAESSDEKQSLQEYRDYLQELKEAVEINIEAVDGDIESQSEEEE